MRSHHIHHSMLVFFAFSVLAVFVFMPLYSEFRYIAMSQVATVSQMGASVAPNPSNTLALALRNRANELDAKEQDIAQRENALRIEREAAAAKDRNLLVGGITFALLLLASLNTYAHHRDIQVNKSKVREIVGTPSSIHIPHNPFVADLHNVHRTS